MRKVPQIGKPASRQFIGKGDTRPVAPANSISPRQKFAQSLSAAMRAHGEKHLSLFKVVQQEDMVHSRVILARWASRRVAFAIQDTAKTVKLFYARFLREEKITPAAKVLNAMWQGNQEHLAIRGKRAHGFWCHLMAPRIAAIANRHPAILSFTDISIFIRLISAPFREWDRSRKEQKSNNKRC
ncbi:MAG: hypothetical protein J0I19_07400 [Alphaproteobacteria bacterium]|nr:hypothetical protein [Alphaproteobacteria bacterium]